MKAFVAVIAAAGLFAAAGAARADYDPRHWEYLRAVGSGAQGYLRADLDLAAYAHAAPDFADVRLLGLGDAEVPYALQHELGGSETVDVPARILNSGEENGEAVFELDLGAREDRPDAERLHNRLALELEGANFVRRVEIAVKVEDAYRVLSSDGLVFDYRVGARSYRESTVAYPDTDARFLRVRLGAGEGGPPRVAAAHVKRTVQKRAEPQRYSGQLVSTEQLGDVTEFVFDLGTNGAPADRVRFTFASDNFMRPVQVGFGDARERLAAVSYSGELVNVQRGGLSLERDQVETPSARGRYLKLRVLNGDDKPVEVSGVEAAYFPFTLVAAADAQPLRLAYGNAKARRPVYDFARQLEATRPEVRTAVALGVETLNPRFEREQAPLTERLPWLPDAAVALGAVALGAVLWRSLRAMKRPGGDVSGGSSPGSLD